MNGAPGLAKARCNSRANTSLPVPVSPCNKHRHPGREHASRAFQLELEVRVEHRFRSWLCVSQGSSY
jgi:hypothetical protein